MTDITFVPDARARPYCEANVTVFCHGTPVVWLDYEVVFASVQPLDPKKRATSAFNMLSWREGTGRTCYPPVHHSKENCCQVERLMMKITVEKSSTAKNYYSFLLGEIENYMTLMNVTKRLKGEL